MALVERSALEELAGRVGEATGGDREIDLALATALVPDVLVLRQRDDDTGADPYTHWEYTAKIDDALALVERMLPGAGVALYWSAEGASAGVSYGPKFIEYWNTIGKRPAPIAILSALLNALSSHPGTPE